MNKVLKRANFIHFPENFTATMLQKEDKPFKTSVEAAVAYLIGKGIIKKDADIVEALKMSKGTFSAYKSGKIEPSKNFVQDFENFYQIKLSDFDPDNPRLYQNDEPSNVKVSEKEFEYLKEKLADKEAIIQTLQGEVASLKRLVDLQEKLLNSRETTSTPETRPSHFSEGDLKYASRLPLGQKGEGEK